jgi:hypothetical protein
MSAGMSAGYGFNQTQTNNDNGQMVGNGMSDSGNGYSVFSQYNTVNGTGNLVNGSWNSIEGNGIQVTGNSNQILGDNNSVIGDLNALIGNSNTIVGSQNVVIGTDNVVGGSSSTVVGNGPSLKASGVSIAQVGPNFWTDLINSLAAKTTSEKTNMESLSLISTVPARLISKRSWDLSLVGMTSIWVAHFAVPATTRTFQATVPADTKQRTHQAWATTPSG